ncbi:homoserine O-acetyltransferase [Actinomyces sp. B33]|uniref:homoserine O-acetyltransferase MetX n=1 Tax=Actinomyces sp. B33 TaxID=2942131 RepID=UPI002340F5A0|nr:homoserine O-acetyltransferase [Actinomyces sp. B33]MDC4233510.1 homoserine O-acetyltransferase [Actinomyces sp. B33]
MTPPAPPPVPVSGGWHEGDPVASRLFADLGSLRLENGRTLDSVRLAYETWGELDEARSNAVLILHALTGDAHVLGDAGPGQPTPGWWGDVVGPGRVVDTDRHYVVAVNVLGGCLGSTGPSSLAPDGRPWGSRFPVVSTRDQVRAEARLADLLGIDVWSAVIGASLGGQRAVEWAVSYPDRVERLIVVASGAQTTAEQAAWTHAQIRAIELDPRWKGGDYHGEEEGPAAGLALARQIAHTTYRSPGELDARFGRLPQGGEDPLRGGRLAVESYLDYHGDKIVRRFDAGSYVALCRCLLTHDVGRDRGGVREALSRVTARTLVVAVDSDRLFFPEQVWQMAAGISGAYYREIHSDHGHDGFLIESDQVTALFDEFLNERIPSRTSVFAR